MPEPRDPAGAARSRLDWQEPTRPGHARMLAFYRRLIALRKAYPQLSDPRLDRVQVVHADQFIAMHRGSCVVVANFADQKRRIGLDAFPRDVLLATEPGLVLIRTAVELPPQSAAVIRC